MSGDDVIGVAEAGRILGRHPSMVIKYARQGSIPTLGKGPGHNHPWLFERAAIEAIGRKPNGHPNRRGDVPAEWVRPIAEYTAWLEFRDLSEQTIELRTSHVSRFAIDSGKPPFEYTAQDVIMFLTKPGRSKASNSSLRASLVVFGKWAVFAGYMAKNPADEVPRIKVPMGQPKPVTEDAYQEALDNAPDSATRLAIRLAGEVGLRRTEAAQVHIDDLITTEHGPLLRIMGKGRKERVVPLSVDLADTIRTHVHLYGKDGYVFPGESGGHLTPHWLAELVTRALPAGYSMHKLRHRALTQVYKRSQDIVLTAKLAGHSSVNTTSQYYVEPDYARMREIVEGMSS